VSFTERNALAHCNFIVEALLKLQPIIITLLSYSLPNKLGRSTGVNVSVPVYRLRVRLAIWVGGKRLCSMQ